MKQYILSLIFAAIAMVGYSQNVNTKTMQFEGEEVLATQDIDQKFLGTYMQNQGSRQYQYNIQNEGSFRLEKTNGDWNADQKKPIEWGVLVKNNEIAKAELTEFDGSEMRSYEAMVLLVHNTESGKYTYYNLYERDGAIYLDEAVKVAEVANKN